VLNSIIKAASFARSLTTPLGDESAIFGEFRAPDLIIASTWLLMSVYNKKSMCNGKDVYKVEVDGDAGHCVD
jgi:hypothetical protein